MRINIVHPEQDVERVLYTKEQIAARVAELGKQLTEDYLGKRPVVVCILTGASVFYVDLCREIATDLEMDFIIASSYGASTTSSGVIKMIKDLLCKMLGF